MMKTLHTTLTCIFCIMLMTFAAHAAVNVYEGFNYPSSTSVNTKDGGDGWGGVWGINGGSPSIVAGYRSTSVYNTAFLATTFTNIGGSLQNDHNTFFAERSFTNSAAVDLTVDGAAYFSFLMSYPETSSASWLEFTGASINSPYRVTFNGTSVAATGGGGTYSTTGSDTYEVDTVYFIIGKITTSASGNDYVSVNVYKSGDTVPATEAFIVQSTGATSGGEITGINFHQGDPDNNDGNPAVLDEFRLGDSWTDVAGIPEPGILAVVALAICSFVLRRV